MMMQVGLMPEESPQERRAITPRPALHAGATRRKLTGP